VNANPQWKQQYGSLLGDLEKAYSEFEQYGKHRDYWVEITSQVEIFNVANQLNNLITTKERNGEAAFNNALSQTKASFRGYIMSTIPQ
jgi:hypothetical protein